jgi:hypothetical protein
MRALRSFVSPENVVFTAVILLSLLFFIPTQAQASTSLTLVKNVIGDVSATQWPLFAFLGSTDVSGGGVTTGTTIPVSAGSYQLFEDESAVVGFTQQGWACTGFTQGGSFTPPNTVTINEGEQITCTVTNYDSSSPSLRLVKVVSDNSASPASWELSAATLSGAGNFTDAGDSTTFHKVRIFSTYTISESGPSGYVQSGFSCDGTPEQRNAGSSTVQILQQNIQITCTITNSPQSTSTGGGGGGGGGTEKQNPTLSITNSPVVYNGAAQSATIVGSTAGAVSNIKYNGSATVPTDAGTYAVTADFTPDDTANFNSLTGAPAGNFVIEQAASAVTVTCPSSVVYSSAPQTPCNATATGPGLNAPLSIDYTNNTTVGTAGAQATFSGDSNHTGSSNSATFAITKAAALCTVTPYHVVYDGVLHIAAGSCHGVGSDGTLAGLDLSATAHTAVGVYNDSWNFSDLTGNYQNQSGTVLDQIGYRFDGFLQPINDTAHQVGVGMSVFKGGSTVPVKFQLKDAAGHILQASVAPYWLNPIDGGPMTSTSTNEITYTDTPSSGPQFKWDQSSQQYIYNWSTKGFQTGRWWKIYAVLNDGTIQTVTIGLR